MGPKEAKEEEEEEAGHFEGIRTGSKEAWRPVLLSFPFPARNAQTVPFCAQLPGGRKAGRGEREAPGRNHPQPLLFLPVHKS